MEYKHIFFLCSLLIIGLISSSSATRLIGGYQPIIDPNDPYVVEIAKFAVSEHNKKASSNLVFVKVVIGEEQAISGTYNLKINAKTASDDGANAEVYLAIVYDRPLEKYRKLASFIKL